MFYDIKITYRSLILSNLQKMGSFPCTCGSACHPVKIYFLHLECIVLPHGGAIKPSAVLSSPGRCGPLLLFLAGPAQTRILRFHRAVWSTPPHRAKSATSAVWLSAECVLCAEGDKGLMCKILFYTFWWCCHRCRQSQTQMNAALMHTHFCSHGCKEIFPSFSS